MSVSASHSPSDAAALHDTLQTAILALLAARARGVSIYPSEVARHLERTGSWRELTRPVREAARRLAARGLVEITQGGRAIDGAAARGPIRLRRPSSHVRRTTPDAPS